MDISSLLSSLSQEDIERLKSTAQQFFGSPDTQQENKKTIKAENEGKTEGLLPELPFDPKLLTGVARFSQMMNENDEKSAFIMSLKPLLSEHRRKKADDAVMMLKFFRIINLLQENGR